MRKILFALVLASAVASAQTRVVPPKNSYTPAQDVQLGQQAAAQARQQLPIMHDDEVSSYVETIGRRLVNAIPPEVQHPEFRYSFEVVDVREINAFALPGGPMFVNRGMIEAAHDEGEIAGVMAHELSHVVLRHGTAQASKATKYEIGEIAGAILGSIVGGVWGNVISQGTQFGLGTAFLRFSREFEHDADIEGSHIMARAGYDPRDMANMFKTIEKQASSSGPEWLSDHPNPGNRYEYITAEARALQVENAVKDTRAFEQVKSHLRSLPPAPTTEQATRNARTGRPRGTTGSIPTGRVEAPSSRFTTYNEGNLFRVSVPSNWRELQSNASVTFAPEGGYGEANGQSVFTHGVEIGIAGNESHDLQTATDELISSLAQGNPNLSRPSGYQQVNVGNRRGLRTLLSNRSDVTGRSETIEVVTTFLSNGNLLYAIGVAPRDEFGDYQSVFSRVISSLQFNDRG
jgi:Zn-dependent protease with chaperone function